MKANRILDRVIRVDHAGEYGAKRIYQGQLAVLKNRPSAHNIKHMLEQEMEHLNYFEQKLISQKARPTILQPLWHIAGFALGAATALMGEKAAYACTVAVEEVIDEHYQNQIIELRNSDLENKNELLENIEKFRQEELEHRNTGLQNNAEDAFAYSILSVAIKKGSRAAIWLAERF